MPIDYMKAHHPQAFEKHFSALMSRCNPFYTEKLKALSKTPFEDISNYADAPPAYVPSLVSFHNYSFRSQVRNAACATIMSDTLSHLEALNEQCRLPTTTTKIGLANPDEKLPVSAYLDFFLMRLQMASAISAHQIFEDLLERTRTIEETLAAIQANLVDLPEKEDLEESLASLYRATIDIKDLNNAIRGLEQVPFNSYTDAEDEFVDLLDAAGSLVAEVNKICEERAQGITLAKETIKALVDEDPIKNQSRIQSQYETINQRLSEDLSDILESLANTVALALERFKQIVEEGEEKEPYERETGASPGQTDEREEFQNTVNYLESQIAALKAELATAHSRHQALEHALGEKRHQDANRAIDDGVRPLLLKALTDPKQLSVTQCLQCAHALFPEVTILPDA